MEKEDLYSVMGLNNQCSQGDLRLSYKNLVLILHFVGVDMASRSVHQDIEKDEAKMKFQSLQRAYSVLSDSNKRFLYDVGAYESDDDETGMADFINEMVTLMAKTQSTGDESLEEFEELLEELLKDDVNIPSSTSVHRDDIPNNHDN